MGRALVFQVLARPVELLRRHHHAVVNWGGNRPHRAEPVRPAHLAEMAHSDARVAAHAAAHKSKAVQGYHFNFLRAVAEPVSPAVRVRVHRLRVRDVRSAAVRRSVVPGQPFVGRNVVRERGVLRPQPERLPERDRDVGVPVHREQLVRGDGRVRGDDRLGVDASVLLHVLLHRHGVRFEPSDRRDSRRRDGDHRSGHGDRT
mmetsp:Transcript_4279/g.14253  ORF Transcript_4279/g.14253 Transcript_4279/m.14253 type:complete len:202 (-) Transcript_4279:665-1270(-)